LLSEVKYSWNYYTWYSCYTG